jgi:hypothetical protein
VSYKVPLHINTQEDSGTANTGSLTITKPTGLAVDDLMLATFAVNNSTITAPADWSLYDNDQPSANLFTSQVFYKIATSGDVAAASFNFSASSTGSPFCGAISAYRYVDTSTPIHTATQSFATTAASHSSPSITTTVPALLVHVRHVRNNNPAQVTFTASGTERQEFANNGATVSYAGATYDSGAINLAGTHSGISITGSATTLSLTDSVTRTLALTAQTLSSSDTVTSTETQTVTVPKSGTETSSGTETQSLAVALNGSDTLIATESQTTSASHSKSDTVSSAETQSIVVQVSSSDSATGTDSQSLAVAVSNSDSVSGVDTGSATDSTTPSSSDTVTSTESQSVVVQVQSSDACVATDSSNAPGILPPEIGDYIVTLVQGPATIYVADYGTTEPTTTDPLASPWVDLGGTLEGVLLSFKQEYEPVPVTQLSDNPASRIKKRQLEVETNLAEPVLTNILYAVNQGTLSSGSGYNLYEPPHIDRATPLTYRIVVIDGWAPGFNTDNRHKRRRVVLRKALAIDGTVIAYSKSKQTGQEIKWSVHHIDGVTAPFKIIDEV